jgi:hypothetical protein
VRKISPPYCVNSSNGDVFLSLLLLSLFYCIKFGLAIAGTPTVGFSIPSLVVIVSIKEPLDPIDGLAIAGTATVGFSIPSLVVIVSIKEPLDPIDGLAIAGAPTVGFSIPSLVVIVSIKEPLSLASADTVKLNSSVITAATTTNLRTTLPPF